MMPSGYSPFEDLAARLPSHALPHQEAQYDARTGAPDGSHDLSHLQRVWTNAQTIRAEEGGDPEILLAATILHDCVAFEKDSPLRAEASRFAARRASEFLRALD